jgi:hypothetical protein
MSDKRRQLEPPFGLDMDFEEALSRFVATKPKEVEASIERSKKKRPPRDGPPRRSARSRRGMAPSSDRSRKQDDG